MRGLSRLFGASLLFITINGTVAAAESSDHANRLNAGETVSMRMGNSLLFQQIYDGDAAEIATLATEDVSGLRRLIPQLGFGRAFTDEGGRKFLYLKLNGISRGDGILMEVRQGLDGLFKDAPSLKVSFPASAGFRPQLAGSPWTKPFKSAQTSIVLEGPLNESFDLAGIGLLFEMQVHGAGQEKALLSSIITLYPRTPEKELGDFQGITERRLAAAEFAGQRLFRSLVGRLK